MHHANIITAPSPGRFYVFANSLRFVLILMLYAMFFSDACRADALLTIAPHSQQPVTLTGSPGNSILFLEGRLVSRAEMSPEMAIRLYLNGVLLDGNRLLGSNIILTPNNPKLTTPPYPRYSAIDRCFFFPTDSDYIAGNGPFRFSEAGARTLGCPYLLQLNVGNLLRATGNELFIVNGSHLPFEIRQCTLKAHAVVVEESLPRNPTWTLFYYSEEMRKRYAAALLRDTWTAEDKAHILTAFGSAELLREGGDREQAVHDWQQALATSTHFDLCGEASYRLAAERLHSGKWADEKTEALVRAAAVGNESWAELTTGILKVIDHRPVDESPRLIIKPPLVEGPQVVDGMLDEKFWSATKVYSLDYPMTNWRSDKTLPNCKTDVRFAVLPDGLAVGFTGEIPTGATWLTGIGRDEPVWEDNAVEFFVSPGTDLHYYYELNASPIGGQFDGRHEWWWNTNPAWNGDWQVAARITGTHFSIEYFVPWADLGLTAKPAKGAIFIVGVTRYLVGNSKEHDDGLFYTLTPHREYDCHRLMDGAILVMP